MMTERKFIIGLCDDEAYVHKQIQGYLNCYSKKYNLTITLQSFYSGKELINQMPDLNLLLLDIDMPNLDGIETARILNDREIDYKIVLLTSKRERFKDGYKIGAFRFVTKPIDEIELFEAINNVYKRILGIDQVEVFLKGQKHLIEQKDIVYILADKAQTIIFTKLYEFRSELSLIKWQNILEPRLFVKTHRSYLVNLAQIDTLENEMIVLRSSEKIPISRRQKSVFLNAFMEYDTKYR